MRRSTPERRAKRDSLPRSERGSKGARRSTPLRKKGERRAERDSLARSERGVWGVRRSTPQDQIWMSRALRLAARGLGETNPNPLVGCVIVKGGAVVGEAWH